MKRLRFLPSVVVVLSVAVLSDSRTAWSSPERATWQVDPVHSAVLFKIKHLGASWVWGRFNDFSASFEADETASAVSSVSFDVKAESVDTGNAKRDQHLRSPDFFNAKQFPEISFRSTGVKAAGADAWDVTGELALHGETKPLTVHVTKVGAGKGMKGEDLVGFESTVTLKRTDFGMTTMVGPVGDEVTLTVAVEASRK